MKELDKEAIAEQQEETYLSIREYIISAQNKVKSAVNHAIMLTGKLVNKFIVYVVKMNVRCMANRYCNIYLKS